ncbi:MAG TPA: TylF/MycF/NovP-related O-methyltransferase, partial [Bacteroidia bacterium]
MLFSILKRRANAYLTYKRYSAIYQKYKDFSMIPMETYIGNLILCERFKEIGGCIVECGVWRGGMIGGFAEILGNQRSYFLFDSFEGLPEAKEIDGKAAINWQNDKQSPNYFNNCAAEMKFAENAMKRSG